MKRILFTFLILLLIITSVNALEIYDEDDISKSYFSISKPVAFVKTDEALENFTVEYAIDTKFFTEAFELDECGSKYCGEVDLTDLIDEENGTFTGSTKFNFIVGSKNKLIYLDFERPLIEFGNYTIDKNNRLLSIEFSYSENTGNIKRTELYRFEDSNSFYVATLKDKTNFDYKLEESGQLRFRLEIEDEAGNENSDIITIDIPDLFAPTLKSYQISKDGTQFEFSFTANDNEELKEYIIKRGTLEVKENLDLTEDSGTLTLPFNSGKFTLQIYDKDDNVFSKEFSLESTFKTPKYDEFTNKRVLKLITDADRCYFQRIDTDPINKEFSKSGEEFTREIDIEIDREYTAKFFCEKGNFKEYFTETFTYDTTPPIASELEIQVGEFGSLELIWSESTDVLSEDVDYRLFKNGDEIYEGSKLDYSDFDVTYPKEYTYFVEVYDEAGNDIRSNEVKGTPKKISIGFTEITPTTFNTNQNSSKIEFKTDPESIVTYRVISGSKVIEENALTTKDGSVLVEFAVEDGQNEVVLTIEDAVGNTLEKRYVVTKETPVLQNTPAEINPQETQNSIEEVTEEPEEVVVKNESNVSSIIWLILIILLLCTFIWFFIIKENSLKERLKNSMKNRENREFHKRRKDDLILGKSLDKARKERIKRQQEREREKLRKEKQREKPKSTYHRQKIDDIAKKSGIHFPLISRKKAEKRVNRIRENTDYEDFVRKERVIKNKKKDDEEGFFHYMKKVGQTSAYSTTADYKQKPEPVQEKQVEQKREEPKKVETQVEKESREKPQKKVSLDDYLNKRTKKRKFYFTEKLVSRDEKNFK